MCVGGYVQLYTHTRAIALSHAHACSHTYIYTVGSEVLREVGGWGRDPKKCTGRDWGMGSSTI